MEPSQQDDLWKRLYADIVRTDLTEAPLLAHYTSTDVLEKIVANDEIWFTHPFLMNDHEELKWGIEAGKQAFERSSTLQKALGQERFVAFIDSLTASKTMHDMKHLFDTYVFCLSEHHSDDGKLSMWRGYGGNGTGAAIIIDPKRFNRARGGLLMFDKVTYMTNVDRFSWINTFVGRVESLLQQHDLSGSDLRLFAAMVFERLKVASIFSKHVGFAEEDEWRIVYSPDRDTGSLLSHYRDYFNGPRGMEPIFRFKLKPVAGATSDDLSLDKFVAKIVLGPSPTSSLSYGATLRMLDRLGKSALVPHVVSSRIPYRAAPAR